MTRAKRKRLEQRRNARSFVVMSTADVARMVGRSPSWVAKRAEELGGEKIDNRWSFCLDRVMDGLHL